MSNPIKLIKVNNMQYNANRDPEIYRGVVGKPMRIQVQIDGTGTASAKLMVENDTLAEQSVTLPGEFDAEVSFDSAASRVGTINIEINGNTFSDYVRLDVMNSAWAG